MAGQSKGAGAIRQVVQVDRDGVTFFRRANLLAADPRVKFIFGRAADEFERSLRIVQRIGGKSRSKAKGRSKATPKGTSKGRSRGRGSAPEIFPFKSYDRVECYVCGYETKGDEMPEMCPSCGAARYAFEREVSQESAWDLVAKTTGKANRFARKVARTAKDPKAKAALAQAASIRKALIDEAREEVARLGGS